MKRFFILYLLFVHLGTSFFSQENNFLDKFSYSMNFKLPKTLMNPAFKTMIFGVGNFDAQFQYEFLDKVELGLGYKYGYFDVNGLAFQTKVDGQMENHNPFIKLGWKNNISDKVFLNFSLKGGYNFSKTRINTCLSDYYQNSLRIEPEMGIYMFSTEYLAFGFIVSYNLWLAEFSPENFCMSSFPGMNPSNSDGYYQTLCVGFGFYTKFPEKKQYGN